MWRIDSAWVTLCHLQSSQYPQWTTENIVLQKKTQENNWKIWEKRQQKKKEEKTDLKKIIDEREKNKTSEEYESRIEKQGREDMQKLQEESVKSFQNEYVN